MMYFRLVPGTWWLASKSDSRWCASGQAGRVPTFIFTLPDEAKATLTEMRRQFGDPPEDLEYGCYRA